MYNGKMCCAVTGAAGYLGSAVTSRLQAGEVEVVELNRKGVPSRPEYRALAFQLGDDVASQAFATVDVLIHCAYDFAVNAWEAIRRVNVEGTRRLLAAAWAGGVRRIIIISTISAFDGCRSLYGRAKLEIERDAARYNAVVVRPGLVYDADAPRGVVGALARVIDLSPIVPLVDGGKQVLYPCHVDDLTHLIYVLCTRDDTPAAGPIIASSMNGVSFHDILAAMARDKGKSPLFAPIPAFPLLVALRGAEKLGVRTRLRSDSLVSLMNQATSVDFSALKALGVRFRGLELKPAMGARAAQSAR